MHDRPHILDLLPSSAAGSPTVGSSTGGTRTDHEVPEDGYLTPVVQGSLLGGVILPAYRSSWSWSRTTSGQYVRRGKL